jgi:hypothetical protein
MVLVDQDVPLHMCHHGRHQEDRGAALVIPSVAESSSRFIRGGIPPRQVVWRHFFEGQAGRDLDLDITLASRDAARGVDQNLQ